LGEWVYRALVVLVISCPCALVISVPLGYFGGIGSASRQGILIKGANYIDMLKDVSTVVLDKTGTITKGAFKVTKIVPRNGFDQQKLLHLAAAAEAHSAHPIAASIRDAYEAMFGASDGAEGKTDSLVDVHEEKGYGITAAVNGRRITVGSDRILRREQIMHADFGSRETAAGTVVYAAVDGTYAGYFVIADEVKAGAAQAVRDLRSAGVDRVVMLTGDNERAARHAAEETGIDV